MPPVPSILRSADLLPGLHIAPTALAYIEAQLVSLSATEREQVLRVLRSASEVNGNRYLGLDEARLALAPFADDESWAEREAQLRELRRDEFELPSGAEAFFTSIDGGAPLLARVLATIETAAELAADHDVCLHAMIFAFTLEEIGSALLQAAARRPRLTIRVLADFSQMEGESSQPVRLDDSGRANVSVRFNKDQPFKWDARRGELIWSHSVSRGMNHHKLLLLVVDGSVREIVSGSFNWSRNALTRNYENVVRLVNFSPEHRVVLQRTEQEFEAFWNDGRASLTRAEAALHKQRVALEYQRQPERPPSSIVGLVKGEDQELKVPEQLLLDVNDWQAKASTWKSLLGVKPALLEELRTEQRAFGRFSSFAELRDRVPSIAEQLSARTDGARGRVWFGPGLLSANTATAIDLARLGIPRSTARRIVAKRKSDGPYESLGQVRQVVDSAAVWAVAEPHLDVYVARVAFTSPRFDQSDQGGGFAEWNEAQTWPLLDAQGRLREKRATIGAGALDLIRRATSGELLVAMYELSPRSLELAALVEAAQRGVLVRVLVDEETNAPLLAQLKIRRAGSNIEVRAPARTMHQKYVVYPAGSDVFNGSANLGEGPSRHAENRFFFHNDPTVAASFVKDFETIWSRSAALLAD